MLPFEDGYVPTVHTDIEEGDDWASDDEEEVMGDAVGVMVMRRLGLG